MEIEVTQVSFVEGSALVAGEPVGDSTKVVLAEAEAAGAIPLAMAVAAGLRPTVDVPDGAILDIIEKPKG